MATKLTFNLNQSITIARKKDNYSRSVLTGHNFGTTPTVTFSAEESAWKVLTPHRLFDDGISQYLTIEVQCTSVDATLTRKNFLGQSTITVNNGVDTATLTPTTVYIDDILTLVKP